MYIYGFYGLFLHSKIRQVNISRLSKALKEIYKEMNAFPSEAFLMCSVHLNQKQKFRFERVVFTNLTGVFAWFLVG